MYFNICYASTPLNNLVFMSKIYIYVITLCLNIFYNIILNKKKLVIYKEISLYFNLSKRFKNHE